MWHKSWGPNEENIPGTSLQGSGENAFLAKAKEKPRNKATGLGR